MHTPALQVCPDLHDVPPQTQTWLTLQVAPVGQSAILLHPQCELTPTMPTHAVPLGAVMQSPATRQEREQAPFEHLSLSLPQSPSLTQPQPAIAEAHAGSAEPVQTEHMGPQ